METATTWCFVYGVLDQFEFVVISVSEHPYLNISLGTCFVCTRNKLLKSSKNKSPLLTPTIFVWAPFPPPSFFFFFFIFSTIYNEI
ncbi:hypothetical protein PRUPE_1G522000 [Prunus persica]|uniref:Uncharacterized protein n=1 Tax=Prunus persica TaxID=3760 RepID=M5XGI1_PRUPE|nr:hypothetical protein PRUPE_1G522000 [Prunus persica]